MQPAMQAQPPSRVSLASSALEVCDDREVSAPLLAPRRRAALTGRALILALVLGALIFTLIVPVKSWLAQRAELSSLDAQVQGKTRHLLPLKLVVACTLFALARSVTPLWVLTDVQQQNP